MSCFSPRQRLEFVAQRLAAAARGELALWNALLALDRAMPLLNDLDGGWRDGNGELIAAISADAHRCAVPLADALTEHVPRDRVFFGLSAFSVLLEDGRMPHAADRVAYARLLLCRISIVLDEAALADRGHPLARETYASLAAMGGLSQSNTIH